MSAERKPNIQGRFLSFSARDISRGPDNFAENAMSPFMERKARRILNRNSANKKSGRKGKKRNGNGAYECRRHGACKSDFARMNKNNVKTKSASLFAGGGKTYFPQ